MKLFDHTDYKALATAVSDLKERYPDCHLTPAEKRQKEWQHTIQSATNVCLNLSWEIEKAGESVSKAFINGFKEIRL